MRCFFLTGAPLQEDLQWDETDLTSIIRKDPTSHSSNLSPSTATTSLPRWRVVSSDSPQRDDIQEAAFLETDEIAAARVDDFLESSALEVQTLHLPMLDEPIAAACSQADAVNDSFYSMLSEAEQQDITHILDASSPQAILPRQLVVTDLKDIPQASHLQSIVPQTVTIHTLVGIISVRPTRTVQLRRSNAQMDLIEVVVGDESRAGFTITFWLMPASKTLSKSDELRAEIMSLHNGDVALFSNVALTTFNGCVYGQSLNRRSVNCVTKIWRMRESFVPPPALAQKFAQVYAWRSRFLDITNDTRTEVLPPETQ